MVSGIIIKDVVEHLQDKIACMELYQTVHGLVKQITDAEGKMFPASYTGKGKYAPLEYSQSNGMAYFRKSGDVSMTEPDTISPCDNMMEFSIPLKLISFIKLGDGADAYWDDSLAQSLTNTLSSASIKSSSGAVHGNATIESYSTDRVAILEGEYNELQRVDFNLDYSYLSVSLIVKLTIDMDCIEQICYGYDYCISPTQLICPSSCATEREIIKYTTAGQSVYSFPSLAGKEITSFQFGQINLAPNQYSLAANGDVTLIDTGVEMIDISFPINPNVYMKIKYK